MAVSTESPEATCPPRDAGADTRWAILTSFENTWVQ